MYSITLCYLYDSKIACGKKGIYEGTNHGFYAPRSFDEGFSNDTWVYSIANDAATWQSESIASNPNANAIRWGTAYNFWFTANRAPIDGTIELYDFAGGNTEPLVVRLQVPGNN